jgi:hypothetical protein
MYTASHTCCAAIGVTVIGVTVRHSMAYKYSFVPKFVLY